MGKHFVITPSAGHYNFSCFAFHRWAADYRRAAELWLANVVPDGFSPVPYFLCCQSIELALKAFLLYWNCPKQELAKRRVGHDLEVLLAKARERGLDQYVTVDQKEALEISKATKWYDRNDKAVTKRLQYVDVASALGGFPDLPDLKHLMSVAARLTENAELHALYLDA